MKVAFV
jgi:hypothetical protein